MRAYSPSEAHIIREYDTVLEYSAVNDVQTRGGTINGPGPTIVEGPLLETSGYSQL